MLDEYAQKRHFARTPEPSPDTRLGQGPLAFVVQKHAARRLHYDFRLEAGGVLKSWAIPSGPSPDPKVKRLAVMVEDHPVEYQSFEGLIPAGEYGAGQVIVWDQGTYSPEQDGRLFFDDRRQAEELMQQGLDQGKISLFLRGRRLKGSWALVKMRRTPHDWLLIKHLDEFAQSGLNTPGEDSSVISGLTIQDLKEGRSVGRANFEKPAEIFGSRPAPFPDSIRPMLAFPAASPFSDPAWLFEPKLDGYRIMTFLRDGEVRLVSRNGLVVSDKYPGPVESLVRQKVKETVLDGEMVALDEKGRPCFQCLQEYGERRITGEGQVKYSLIYYIFDILYLNGYNLLQVPLHRRKALLAGSLKPSENVRLVDYFDADGEALYAASIRTGMEGIIAKLGDSLYEAGRRSRNWLKIKATQSDDFVIGGFTRGVGSRSDTFGALLLGSYNDKGQLVFAGHAGSGFDNATQAALLRRMGGLRTEKNPFITVPVLKGPVTWIRPELVAEIKFAERTREGYLRAPVFLHLREDKSPSEIRLDESSPGKPTGDFRETGPSALPDEKLGHILEQLAGQRENLEIEFEGHKISLSHLDKVLWPGLDNRKAVTKRDLLVYLTRVSPYLLPHLKDRPLTLTLTRYPNGIYGEHFFQRHRPGPLPDFVQTFPLSESESGTQDYLVCNNLPTLLWLGQLANIDLHSWFSRITPGPITASQAKPVEKGPDFFSRYPDFIVFDIDPYIYSGNEPAGGEPELNPSAFEQTQKVALWLKELLDKLSLTSFVKTSGQTGLHLYVPIVRQFTFPEVHSAARTIAGFLLAEHPRDITLDWPVSARIGKIFLDYNQNSRGKTLASVYSPRPSPQATVSVPLHWSEVGKVYPTDFTLLNLPERLAGTGDLWVDILQKRSNLARILETL